MHRTRRQKMATTMASDSSSRKRQNESNDCDEADEWIGPMPTEAVKEKKRKGNMCCVVCRRNISSSSDQWVECDTCANGQHITCNTGIPLTLYAEAMKASCKIIWKCVNCSTGGSFALSFVGLPVCQAIPEALECEVVVVDEGVIATPGDTVDALNSDKTAVAAVSDIAVVRDAGISVTCAEVQGATGDGNFEFTCEEIANVNDEGEETGVSYMEDEDVEETPESESAAPVGDVTDVRYSIVEGSPQHQRPKLIDTRGYSYTIRSQTSAGTTWRCSVRKNRTRCCATVLQTGDDVFTFGAKEHNHEGNTDDNSVLQLKLKTKKSVVTCDDRTDVTYSIVEGSSQRQRPKLIDSRGYSYTIRRKTSSGTSWRCSIRNLKTRCYATVLQTGDDVFTFGMKEHNHEGNKDKILVLQLMTKIKEKAMTEVLKSSGSIVNEIIVNEVGPSGIFPGLPSKSTLVRRVNRHRQKLHPSHPKNLEFDLEGDFVPSDFVKGDIHVKQRRHFIMATNSQLTNLSVADVWYVHETNKFVKHPFTHLLTISCYAKKRKSSMLFPFCYVLMSGRKSKDYKEVFRVLKTLVGDTINLSEVFLNFDKALWRSFKQMFDVATLKGYAQQWKEEIWSRITKGDLTWVFLKEEKINELLKQLMSLAFLPPELIPTVFEALKSQVDSNKVMKVFDYVSSTWLCDKLWQPETWSAFQHSVCTCDELEAWHPTSRNTRQSGYAFYKLVKILHQKSQHITPRIRLVPESDMRQREESNIQQSLYYVWDQYNQGTMTADELLKSCSQLDFRTLVKV